MLSGVFPRRAVLVAVCTAVAMTLAVSPASGVSAQDQYEDLYGADDTWSQARDITPYLSGNWWEPDTYWYGSIPRDEWHALDWVNDSAGPTDPPSDEDWTKLTVTSGAISAGYSYLVEAVAVDPLVDPVLEIYGPGTPDPNDPRDLGAAGDVTETDPNALIASDDGVWFADRSSSIAFMPSTAGTYYIRVRPYYQFEGGVSESGFRGGTGRYRLKFKVGQTNRVSGANRIKTAVAVSKERFPSFLPRHGSAEKALVLAHAYSFPDALSGSTLAGAIRGPVLLTSTTSLSADVRAEIDRLNVERVYILGGTAAISDTVASQVAAISVTATRNVEVTRLPGSKREDTARLVALEAAKLGSTSSVAFVSNSKTFPDALAAAPMAVHNVAPILLTGSRTLAAPTEAALRDPSLGITDVIIVGGDDVVSSAVESQIASILKGSSHVKRIAGRTRYVTARDFAVWATGWEAGADVGDHVDAVGTSANPNALSVLDFNRIGLANGQDFPDALAGGVFCGLSRAPILLTKSSSISPYVLDFDDVRPPGSRSDYWGAAPYAFERCYVIGGEAVVNDSVFRVWDIYTGPLSP